MPLALQRPSRSIFHPPRMTNTINLQEEQPAPTPEPEEFHDFFRFYPLSPEAENSNKPSRGAAPVNPLPAPRQAARANAPQRGNLPQQPQLQQRQPPQQRHHQPPIMPPQQPQWQQQMIPPQHLQRPQQQPIIPPQHFQQPQQPPMPAPQPLQMTPPPGPPSPEKAAQHFRNINKGLPDGVMYEPLDDDIMQLLKDNGHIPKNTPMPQNAPAMQQLQQQSQPQTSNQTTPPQPLPTIPSEIAKTIENLTQNEHNAQIFYTGISNTAPTEEIKKSLAMLAEGSQTRVSQYVQFLHANFNSQFSPQNKEININLPFRDAISLAISEENKALSTLCSLLDQAEGTSLERQIERIISKKVVAHQILLTIYTTTIPAPRSLRYPPLSPEASL